MSSSNILISANNITIRLRDHFLFNNTSWKLKKGEQWLIVGENGSGKTTFAKALSGLLPLKTGEIILNFIKGKYPYPQINKDKIAYVSFDTQQQVLKKDSLKRDFDAFVGIESIGTKVRDFLDNDEDLMIYDENFSINSFLERELATLSTGEMRKVFLVKAIMQDPTILILDEPFDGLDKSSKEVLMRMIKRIMENDTNIILIVHKSNEIPEGITHIMVVKDGQIVKSGRKEDIFQKTQQIGKPESQNVRKSDFLKIRQSDNQKFPNITEKETLIDMQNVTVKYGNKIVLDNITWQLKDGENWAILGQNGAGKSTLLQLITGDHQQRFANNISIFGKKKDEGISIWDIKKAIGIVSADLMLKHVYEMKAESVVLSGFFDSIGLYKTANPEQKNKAGEWINNLGIQDLVKKNYQQLSFGQKRLILIARAVVKSPKILVLDEPCHGLDTQNRKKVLDMIEEIGNTSTNLLLVTHNPEEIVNSITNVLELENGKVVKKVRLR